MRTQISKVLKVGDLFKDDNIKGLEKERNNWELYQRVWKWGEMIEFDWWNKGLKRAGEIDLKQRFWRGFTNNWEMTTKGESCVCRQGISVTQQNTHSVDMDIDVLVICVGHLWVTWNQEVGTCSFHIVWLIMFISQSNLQILKFRTKHAKCCNSAKAPRVKRFWW